MSELRMEKLSMESVDITQENIEKIKELFPNVVTEGKIDFDQLKLILGEQIEARNERYQFTWNGKSDSIRFAQRPSTGTLRPNKESSKNWDITENLYIEGDNLEVLKLLQKSYHNKIKMIYIDPPYNTGGDFVYKDDFKDSIKNYKEQTNQAQRANPETSGRYHTDWLNMMYPRLMLAKNLLSEDGVIFISIDDNEVENLKKICIEMFGEENFIAAFPWRKRTAKSDVPFGISQDYEWIISLSKSSKYKALIDWKGRRYYDSPDFPNDAWRIHDLTKQTTASERPNSFFDIVDPKNGKVYKPNSNATWRITKDTINKYLEEKRIVFPGDYDFLKISKPVFRYFLSDDKKKGGEEFGYVSVSTKLPDQIGLSQDGTKEIMEILDQKVFNFPKPSSLISHLIKISTIIEKSPIILDFFSGSATTAHAVMQLNAEDGGNRKFIMVQLPEKTDEKSEAYKAGYENICEIGKERIRRAGDKIRNELVEKQKNQGMLEDSIDPNKLDIGFKVFKLDTSNFSTFDSSSKDLDNIFNQEVFVSERSSHDILYEILLKYGVFDKPVDVLNINGKEVFSVAMNQTIVFINNSITEEDIIQIAMLKPREVIFDERGFESDNDKINAMKRLETAGVEKVATI